MRLWLLKIYIQFVTYIIFIIESLIKQYHRDILIKMQTAQSQRQKIKQINTIHLSKNVLSHHLDKIRVAKRRRISITNEQIKIRTVQTQKKVSFQNNNHLPQVNLQERIKKNQKVSNSTFYIKLFSPHKKNIKTPSIISDQKSENSKIINKSGLQNLIKRNEDNDFKFNTNQSFYYLQQMKKISQHLKEQILQKRLNMLSNQKGKSQLRIYKEDIHKLIVHRFGKDRITTLLNTQYIQDYDSILKTMKQLTNLKQQQMLVLSFLIMDQNKDGLITTEDLMSILGVKKQGTLFNELIAHDALKIIQYIQTMKKQNIQINDSVSNSILKDQKLTFMTYRINKLRENKLNFNSHISRASIISGRPHQRLYSLQIEPQIHKKVQEQQAKLTFQQIFMKIFKNSTQKNKTLITRSHSFAINFERYSSIFSNQIPRVFLDFLYLFGAIELPKLNYLPIDIEAILFSNQKELKQEKQQNKMNTIFKRLLQMNNFKKQLKTLRINTEP